MVRRDFPSLIFIAAIALVFGLAPVRPTAAYAKEKSEASDKEETDILGLAALMIRDGHFERAETLLLKVDEGDEKIDKARLYTLTGLLLLRRELYTEANLKLSLALKAGYDDPILHVYIAQALYGLKEYDQSLEALDRAGDAGKAQPELLQLRAQCHWKARRAEKAWDVIAEGESRFPGNSIFQRQKIFYLIELGLFQQAVEKGESYLRSSDVKPEDYVAVGEALRLTGQAQKAIPILELAHLRFPEDMTVVAELAHTYLDEGFVYTAATLFERAALADPNSYVEAAELFRRKNLPTRALYANMRIPDQKEKVRQRLGILLQRRRYDLAVALEARLSRLGLLADDEIRYAMAYCHFKLGRFDKTEKHLKSITRPDLFHSAMELRKAMQSCGELGWECY